MGLRSIVSKLLGCRSAVSSPSAFIDYVNENADAFVERLTKGVGIPSVSGDAAYRGHVFKMADFVKSELESCGISVRLADMGKQVLAGQELDLPPLVLASIGNDKNKKTVVIYAHYDVQPALESDGWDSDPFILTVDKESGRLFGRGSTDDKGPLLAWINVLQAHHDLNLDLPVNLRIVFEGMEESGSHGLDEFILAEREPGKFLDGVDCACISDNYWLNNRTPCITYGLRGLAYFKVNVSGPSKDLHSGVFGATVHEPMTDLVILLSKLVSPQGKILIPGIDELVEPLAEAEIDLYTALDYGVKDIEEIVGASIAVSSNKETLLMNRMRYPSLSIHGIEGAFSAPGTKTVIPANVSGKFSLRLVPNQTPETVESLVRDYLEKEFAELGSKNTLQVELLHGGNPWVASLDHYNYRAAIKATEIIYNQTPDLFREGGTIPVVVTIAETLNVNVCLIPVGRGNDGAHSTNEKIDLSNYIEGTKLLGTYLYEIAAAQ